jgi:hypothetical protein
VTEIKLDDHKDHADIAAGRLRALVPIKFVLQAASWSTGALVDLFWCQLLASTRRTSHARRQRAEAKPTDQTSCILTSNRAPFEQHVFPSTESCRDLKFLDADGSRELIDLMGTQSDSATDSGRRGSLSMLM